MFFDKDNTDRLQDTQALGEPTTFSERFAASFDATVKTANFFSQEQMEDEAYQRRNKAIKDALGVELPNPRRQSSAPGLGSMEGFGGVSEGAPKAPPPDFHREYQRKLEELAAKHPEHRGIIAPHKPVRAEAAQRARESEEHQQDVERRYGGPYGTGVIASLAGGIAAQAYDPINLLAMLIGPMGRVGLGAREIIIMGAKSAAANAAVEAAMQPKVQDWREKIGLPSGFGEAATNVAMAGAFGFALDAGVRTAYRGGQRLLDRKPILDDAGKVTGYEGADAAATRAENQRIIAEAKAEAEAARTRAEEVRKAVEALPQETKDKAQAGDLDALIAVGEAARLDESPDPAAAGMLKALRNERDARVAIEGIDDGSGLADLSQAMRAISDPSEPPPVRLDTPTPARTPDLSDEAALPTGTKGNQHARDLVIDGKPASFRSFDPNTLTTDAQAFQFKGGGDGAGVTGRLGSVRTWDPMASGKIVVYERADGTLVIADGHQRLGLARALADQSPELQGFLFREVDGWSTADVRAMAAKKNLQEGSGSLIDAARIMRDRPDIIDDRMPMGSEFMRVARSLSRLSDEAFGQVIGGVVEPKHGAMVADLVADSSKHAAVIDELARLNPETDRQARIAIGEVLRAPVTAEQQMSLLGAEVVPRFLMRERMELLDGALKALRSDARLFGSLDANAERIEGAGNRLTADNAKRSLESGTVALVIERVAQQRGIVSDWLNEAARAVADGQPKKRAIDAFIARVQQHIDEKGVSGLDGEPVRLAAISNSGGLFLDMSPEARKARAEAMGFDTSKVLYHGTATPFDRFDKSKFGTSTKASGAGQAAWFVDNPTTAAGYADYAAGGQVREWLAKAETYERLAQKDRNPQSQWWDKQNSAVRQAESIEAGGLSGQSVLPVFVRGKLLEHDFGGREYVDVAKEISRLLREAKTSGYDGLKLLNLSDDVARNNRPATHYAIFDPANIRSVNAAFDPSESNSPLLLAAIAGSDAATGRSMRRDLDALGYYSQALEAAKAWPQAKGTPEQALAWLKKSSVKDAEIEATKVGTAFEGQKSITRDDLVKHLTENRVGLRNVNYETTPPIGQADFDAYRSAHGLSESERITFDQIGQWRGDREVAGLPKWSAYSLDPSNPTYRETVLHLPSFDTPIREARKAVLDEFKMLQDRYSGNGDSLSEAEVSRMETLRGDLQALALDLNAAHKSNFQSGHFPGVPNITGHLMTSLTKHDGKVVYTVDQIQSDWGQRIRDRGVRDEAKIAELEKTVADSETLLQQLIAERNTFVDEHVEDRTAVIKASVEPGDGQKPLTQRKMFSQQYLLELMSRLAPTPEVRAQAAQIQERLAKVGGDVSLRKAELRTAEASATGHPLVNTTDQWVNTTLRRALRQAVEADAAFIAIPHGDTVLSYNPGDTDGMRGFYGSRTSEGIVPKNLRKLLEKIDKDAVKATKITQLETPTDVRGYRADGDRFDKDQTGFTLFPITDKVKQSILEDGQPLFSKQDADTVRPKLQDFAAKLEQVLSQARREVFEQIDDAAVEGKQQVEALKLQHQDAIDPVIIAAVNAYHGTPHKFDRMSMEFIGKGEGVQAFGSGLYFTETEEVAKQYAATVRGMPSYPTLDGQQLVPGKTAIDEFYAQRSATEWKLRSEISAAVAAMLQQAAPPPRLRWSTLNAWRDVQAQTQRGPAYISIPHVIRVQQFVASNGGDAAAAARAVKTAVDRFTEFQKAYSAELGEAIKKDDAYNLKRGLGGVTQGDLATVLHGVSEWPTAKGAAVKLINSKLTNGVRDVEYLAGWIERNLASGRLALSPKTPPGGYVYTVKLDVPDDRWVIWDAPLEAQSAHVRASLEKTVKLMDVGGDALFAGSADSVGARIDPAMIDAEMRRALIDAGVFGIKYLDGHSRDSGQGSYNFVVFDDSRIKITHRNGEPVPEAETPAVLAAMRAETAQTGVGNTTQPPSANRILDLSEPVRHTPEYTARRAEIMREIDRTINMLPPDVAIRVENRLVHDFGDGTSVELGGLWDGYDRLVYVALETGDLVRSARHEVVHALRQSGLMTDQEFNDLYAFAQRIDLRGAYRIDELYRDVYTKAFGHRGNDFVEALLREETIAHMFSDYSLNGRRFGSEDGGGLVDQTIDVIVRFLKQMRELLFGYEFGNVFDVFESIESGAMARRGGVPEQAGAQAARRPALDMSPEARKARAEAMGFDTKTVWYHGTSEPNLSEIKLGIRDPGAWFTTDIQNASNYAKGFDAQVHSVFLKPGRSFIVEHDADGPHSIFNPAVDGKPIAFDDNVSIVRYAQSAGYDSVHFPDGNFSESGNTMVVLNPNSIRDIDAAFDPAEAHSPKLLASFVGAKSKTADLDALARAEQMQAEGSPRDAILQATGWFRGVDGQWRYEIGDSGATLKADGIAKLLDDSTGNEVRLGDLLEHPELMRAVPQLADISVMRGGPDGASFGSNVIQMGENILATLPDEQAMPLRVLMHETQHAIQEAMGFARGADPDRVGWGRYDRAAGEAEARLVETRLDLDPAEREARAPWQDFDIPEANQFVQALRPYLSDGALQLSRDPNGTITSIIEGGRAFSLRRDETGAITALVPQAQKNDAAMAALRGLLPDGAIRLPEIAPMVQPILDALAKGDIGAVEGAARDMIGALASKRQDAMTPVAAKPDIPIVETPLMRDLAVAARESDMADLVAACRP